MPAASTPSATAPRGVSRSLEQLIGNAEVFPVLATRDYFNHAGCSPLPAPVRDAVTDFADHFAKNAYIGFDVAGPTEKFRETCGAVINAEAAEIAIMKNTSEGLSTVALGLDWNAGDRIVYCESEYPCNQYPWMTAAERFGVELVKVPETTDAEGRVFVDPDALLAAAEHPKTRLLTLSHGQWGTGQVFDLERIGAFCRNNDILFNVDAIQTMGVVPIDVKAAKIDFLQAGSHKWMLGPMGAGCLYIRRELIEKLRPTTIGWLNFRDPLQWEKIDAALAEGALRYEYGTPAMPSVVGAGAGLGLLNDVGIEGVYARVSALGDYFARSVADIGYRVVSPRHLGCGGSVCFLPETGEPKRIFQALSKQQATELAFRCGRIRFSPHFYNTEKQVDRVLERLQDLA